MKNNAIIVHGTPDRDEYYNDIYPSASNSHWIPWLQKQLLIKDVAAHTPEMPHAFAPDYLTWRKEFERYEITNTTILVGHSCGGGFLVRWLSEHKDVRVGHAVLVAPWLDPMREYTTDFFDFDIDSDLAARTKSLTIFHSDDDVEAIQISVQKLRHEIKNIEYQEFHAYGHFCQSDMKTTAFPELLEKLV